MKTQGNGFQIVLPQDFNQWQWYNKPEIVYFFIHCLFKTNAQDKHIEGMIIKRGSFVSSLDALKEDTGLSVQQLRSCINKLVATNELTSTSTNRYRIITILNYDNYNTDQQASNKHLNKQSNRQEISTMQDYQGFCDDATGKSTNQSTNQSTSNYDNVNYCNEINCDTDQQASNKQLNNPINKQLQRNEKETKKAKEVFPPAPPLQEKEINKEKEKKKNVFFPLSCEKCVFNAASGKNNAQAENEISNQNSGFEIENNFENLNDNKNLKTEKVIDFRFDKQNENENTQKHEQNENEISNQNLSSELENKTENQTQNLPTTQTKTENQKKSECLANNESSLQTETFQEKEKSCDKKEKEVFVDYAPVENWNESLQKIKTSLMYSQWLEKVAMQLDIPPYQIQPIFESFFCEIEATGEHSTSTTPTADIQKHFFYWARLKKQKFQQRREEKVNPVAILQQLKQMGI